MSKIPCLIRTTDQAQEGASHLGEGEGEEDPRNSQIKTQEIHTCTANITEEIIALKGPETKKNIARTQQEKAMMSISSTMSDQLRQTSGNRSL
jgi:hypothetical protein